MNHQDQMPTATRWMFHFAAIIPAAYAGWREQSWQIGLTVLLGGWLLSMLLRRLVASLCVRFNTSRSGSVDAGAARNCFAWPDLAAGPIAACAAAWGVLAYLQRL